MKKRRQRRRNLPSAPVTLDITALSHEGRGIGHLEGKVAFVDGALRGERVLASYIGRRGQFDELKVESILSAAAERVEPRCEFADRCGGCSLQHMDSHAQIEFKRGVLTEQLQHAARLNPQDFELLPNLQATTFNYRRKARLAVRMVMKKGGALVGFREKHSSFITEMDNCQVLHASVARLIQPLRVLVSQLQGSQSIPQIEVAVGEKNDAGALDESGQVALVFRHLQDLSADDRGALTAFAVCHDIELYLQPSNAASVHKIYPTDDIERLFYTLPDYGVRFAFHPLDFTQINADINRLIIGQAIQLLELAETDTVLDLFCGLGNFTLPLATRCQQVIGVEGSEEMVQRGRENARLNNIGNAEFHVANLCEPLANQSWAKNRFSKILLDPPRSGAIEIIQQLAALGAEKILYISCNPATLARDTAELLSAGYRLKSAGVMDMFPHTTHVESMALFERSTSSAPLQSQVS